MNKIIKYAQQISEYLIRNAYIEINKFIFVCFNSIDLLITIYMFFCLSIVDFIIYMITIFICNYLYLFSAIYGDNICNLGVRAFKVIVSRTFEVSTINSIGTFVLILGKLLGYIFNILVGYKIFLR